MGETDLNRKLQTQLNEPQEAVLQVHNGHQGIHTLAEGDQRRLGG